MTNLQFSPETLDRGALLKALRAFRNGDFSVRLPLDLVGVDGEIAEAFNDAVEMSDSIAEEFARIRDVVGKEGQIGQRVKLLAAKGSWSGCVESVNTLIGDLVQPTAEVARVIESVAKGDLAQAMVLEIDGRPLRGEFLRIGKVVNTMVGQLGAFAAEVSRVAREVGTEGKLGGQAQVPGVAGTWKDLTVNVNSMAANLTNQVRGIAQIVTAVANGDLKRKIVFEVKGEIAALADTINSMIDTLATFGDQVTNVAHEVGIEGKLGGQAKVPGAAGLWRTLTDNVNQLAANLTTQVRAIAEVATAVTKGDLTRSILVEARGEVASLKDNINEMIRNLKDTTLKNTEQDWLKTNLARFGGMLQGHRDLVTFSKLVLSELAPLVNAQQGVIYAQPARGDELRLELLASYAHRSTKHLPKTLRIGEGLIGQCAQDKKRILLTDVPHDYIRAGSALGSATTLSVIILPVLFEDEVKAVIELASFKKFSDINLSFLDQLTESIGIVFNTIEAGMRTEGLLAQSQSLTLELQNQQGELKNTNDRLEQQAENLQKSEALLKKQQDELRQTNEQLEEKARLLSEQMRQVEYKNSEVEQAKSALEEKAEQLALSSHYKSEFLANMSHELRTPLNSMLILARLLADNAGSNLTPKQIEHAQTIHSAGTDLLSLINDILDLAKIESGTVTLNIAVEQFSELREYVERTFHELAQHKKLDFSVVADRSLPATIQTDAKRLQQVLKNLLANAFKFTERGKVSLNIALAKSGWARGHARLEAAGAAVAFTVTDTGIGIPESKQKLIFEAFQQADGTTSRQYGGTGLGLSISRELTRLLGGEIQVSSSPGKGSTFTLYLPLVHKPEAAEETAPTPGNGASKLQPAYADETRDGGLLTAPLLRRPLPAVRDDRDDIGSGDRVVLIVEEDVKFASTLLDLMHDHGFKGVIAPDGGSAFASVKELLPDAITLDLKLPDMDGWTVLDHLKHDPATRHIPVSVISVDDRVHKCLNLGALGSVQKPAALDTLREALLKTRNFIEREVKALLVVDGDAQQRDAIVNAVRGDDVQITEVDTGRETLEALRKNRFDCMVLGPAARDISAMNLLKKLVKSEHAAEVPIVMHAPAGLSPSEQDDLKKLGEIIILKDARSLEAVLQETTLFLHRAVSNLPPKNRETLANLQKVTPELRGRKALIVDDDIRNIFALTGVLEQHGLNVIHAENGKDGIELLERNPDVDIVLMDIMMPELDGYDTIRIIRGLERFKNLPLIAVTAKAMKGDREKCVEAGASDYIAKPVNIEQLLSLLRVWLVN